jgi:hypothetical protein
MTKLHYHSLAIGGTRAPRRRAAPPPVERRPRQPQSLTQRRDADAGVALLDQGDHDRALAPGRPSSAAKFSCASTQASVRSARPVMAASCRSSSAIFRSRGSMGLALRPRRSRNVAPRANVHG